MAMERPPDCEAFKAQVISDQEAGDQGVCEVWWAANSRFPGTATKHSAGHRRSRRE
jgi:hypothetical protein